MRPLDGKNVSGPVSSLTAKRGGATEGNKAGGTAGAAELRKVVLAFCGAGLVGGLLAGCASTGESNQAESSQIMVPQIHAMALVTRSERTAEGYYALGKYYFWQNRFEKARDAFMQSVRLNPESADALNGLGATYDKLGHYQAAQLAYKAAFLKAPESEIVWANMGYSLLLQGKHSEAVPYLREAVRLNSSDRLARLHLAQAEGHNFYAESHVASANPLAALQNRDLRGAETVDGLPRHEEVVETEHVEVIRTIKQGEGSSASGSAVTRVASKKPDPVGIGVQTAQSRGGEQGTDEPGRNSANDLRHARLEISNGNGVTGMARAVGEELRKQGENVARVTNKRPFDTARTVIVCNSEAWSEQAKNLARTLPNSPLVMVGSLASRKVDIRVVLGADAALAWKGNGVKSVLVAATF